MASKLFSRRRQGVKSRRFGWFAADRATFAFPRHRGLRLEPLEQRQVLSSISGTVFDDGNYNGIRDTTIIAGDEPNVVFVVDVSGSTSSGFGGSPVGDVNGDGYPTPGSTASWPRFSP